MTKELITKIKKMLNSTDDEMRALGKTLFWSNDPSLKDYKQVANYALNYTEEEWERMKKVRAGARAALL